MEQKIDAILENVRQLEKRVTDIEGDLAHDRENIQNLTISNGQVVAEVGELRRSINLLSEKVKNKVADAVEQVTVAADQLSTTIEKNKMSVLKERKTTLFQKIFGRY